jgi:NitT/TauT family transport system substrate-binding protein
MKRSLVALVMSAVAVSFSLAVATHAHAEKIRVGWCAKTVSAAAAPYAIATKLGWYKAAGIEVELVPLAGSSDCTRFVVTREMPFSQPSVEPLTVARAQGVKAKIFYTAYQTNIYGIAVPQDSPIHKIADLRGKSIGLISMASAGLPVARALVATAGLDPDRDVKLVVAGEGAQTASLLRSKHVDALSQFDTQYAMVENAGMKLRMLETKDIERFPSNGLLALEETLKSRRKDAVTLGRGYAMGTIFAASNPEAAVRILYEVFPQTKPTGKDEATAIRDDVAVLRARLANMKPEKAGLRRWGENSETNYQGYVDFLLKWNVIKDKIPAKDLVTNELIDEINQFDAAKVAAEAKAYR